MTDLVNLVTGATFEESIIKCICLFACIEFVGMLFGLIGNIGNR